MTDWFIAFIAVLGFGVILIAILVFADRKSKDKTNYNENNHL